MKLHQTYKIPANIHFFALSITISYLLKLFYLNAEINDLTWILNPVQGLVSLFTAIPFTFDPALGYINYDRAITINESCAGINFFIIIMLVSHYSFINAFTTNRAKMKAFVLFMGCAYIITILVNSFRIISSIYFINSASGPSWIYNKMHVATGIIFYFSFLLLYYVTFRKILSKETNNEKTV